MRARTLAFPCQREDDRPSTAPGPAETREGAGGGERQSQGPAGEPARGPRGGGRDRRAAAEPVGGRRPRAAGPQRVHAEAPSGRDELELVAPATDRHLKVEPPTR